MREEKFTIVVKICEININRSPKTGLPNRKDKSNASLGCDLNLTQEVKKRSGFSEIVFFWVGGFHDATIYFNTPILFFPYFSLRVCLEVVVTHCPHVRVSHDNTLSPKAGLETASCLLVAL